MGLAKILGIIFLILILIVAIIGVDIYLTYDTLSNTDLSQTISDPTFGVSEDNSTVTVTVQISLPSAGFIPKGVIAELVLDFSGNIQKEVTEINFGKTDQINLIFELTQENIDKLNAGENLNVDMSANLTPTLFGFPITQATQTVDLGSQTISA